MSRLVTVSGVNTLFCDASVAVALPTIAWEGFSVIVVDNKGIATGTPITVTAPVNGSTSIAISTAYNQKNFVYSGGKYSTQ